jgi:PEP-CTERM motif
MNIKSFSFSIALFLGTFRVLSQGTLVYDQQSVPNDNIGADASSTIQQGTPIGQSFTPTFSSLQFVRIYLIDHNPGNNIGATVSLNLRTDSITGPIASSTDAVFMPDGFGSGSSGITTFLFPTAVAVTPGTTYFFDINLQSGDTWDVGQYFYGYQGGTAFYQGAPFVNHDLWFREGIVATPEPSTISLAVLGIGLFAGARYAKKRKQG